MSSGSYREGFRLRLRSSDEDIMVWSTLYKLIDNSSECIFTDALRFYFILIDYFETPPRFVRLNILTPIRNWKMFFSVVFNRIFSRIYQERNTETFTKGFWVDFCQQKNMQSHGPCCNYMMGNIEFDMGHYFAFESWPQVASS